MQWSRKRRVHFKKRTFFARLAANFSGAEFSFSFSRIPSTSVPVIYVTLKACRYDAVANFPRFFFYWLLLSSLEKKVSNFALPPVAGH